MNELELKDFGGSKENSKFDVADPAVIGEVEIKEVFGSNVLRNAEDKEVWVMIF